MLQFNQTFSLRHVIWCYVCVWNLTCGKNTAQENSRSGCWDDAFLNHVATVFGVECCVRFGSRENPTSHSLPLAAPQSVAVSAQPDYLSRVRSKHTLSSLFSLQGKSLLCRVIMFMAFIWQYKVLTWYTSSASQSSAKVASPGTQCLAQKLDCVRGKSQLFHTTWGYRQSREARRLFNQAKSEDLNNLHASLDYLLWGTSQGDQKCKTVKPFEWQV